MTSDISGTSIAIVDGTVVAIQGNQVSVTPPTTGQFLQWNGTEYVPENLPSSLPPSGSAGGDLSGTYPNPNVVKLQNIGVSNVTPLDGYILMYVSANSDWEPKPAVGLRKDYLTASGSWTAPSGVTNILLIGCGGGGGGGGGNAQGAGGAGGALQNTCYVSVTPGNSYSITIGSGGTGSSGSSNGSDGTDTLFGSLATFTGASGGANVTTQNPGNSIRGFDYQPINANTYFLQESNGGWGGNYSVYSASSGMKNSLGGFSGGSMGATATGHEAGGGGGAGPQGNGGHGGDGSTGPGSSGTSASANTGAGGGGGGGGASGNSAGGNGGSGYLYIIY